MRILISKNYQALALMLAGMLVTVAAYWSGLNGGYLFDDFPNIVDNNSIHQTEFTISALAEAATSSPSSFLQRPLASISFAINHILTGLDPYWMKAGNLLIHLTNGLLLFLLSRLILQHLRISEQQASLYAALTASMWLILPINISVVLYVVQRMESLAQLFVGLGLLGYCHGRLQMLKNERAGLALAFFSLSLCTALGILSKESAALLPLYAFMVECFLYRFRNHAGHRDISVLMMFGALLLVPYALGLAWQLDKISRATAWAARDFSVFERLISEPRILLSYLKWIVLPMPGDLSFYHDNIEVSRSLTAPWTTAVSILTLAALAVCAGLLRQRSPVIGLGIALYLCSHALTATIIPLDLAYEHRNYFASFGVVLVMVAGIMHVQPHKAARLVLCLLAGYWLLFTTWTATAWSHPVKLAQELAIRAPESPGAQYALAQTYIVASGYEPDSPYLPLAWKILEETAALPKASILPESALIFTHSKLGLPIKPYWWDNLLTELSEQTPDSEDQAAIMSLTQCVRNEICALDQQRMINMFLSALDHDTKRPRVLAAFGDYAWNVLQDHALALELATEVVKLDPRQPEYLITLFKMQSALNLNTAAQATWGRLEELNHAGRLNRRLSQLRPTTNQINQ